jgi:MFS family permease
MKEMDIEKDHVEARSNSLDGSDSGHELDNIAVETNDAVLARKIHLINNAIDEMGFTWYHAKLFCMAGFGYSVDCQMEMIQSAVRAYVGYQMGVTGFPISNEIFSAGMICGCIFFGFGCDLIGRKIVFNSSILLTSIFGFFAGGMSSYATYCIFMFLSAFASGGNTAIDVSVFMEFVPSQYQYLNTMLALFWGVGQTISALISWAFIPNFSCSGPENCPSHLNRGWRYCWYVNSAICFTAALIRIFVMKLDETPKFLVTTNRDAEAIKVLEKISLKYNRPMSLTLEDLEACGTIKQDFFDSSKDGYSFKALTRAMNVNLKLLFQNRVMIRSTLLIFLSWGFIGISYSTFYYFLYVFIAARGGDTGSSPYYVYRNATIANFVGIFGPVIAGLMIITKLKLFNKEICLKRKGTMMFGAVASMAILFGYTTVRTPTADAGFGAATYFFVNIYYGTLYAYTPETFPTKARGTGVGVSMLVCRIFGAFAPVINYFGGKTGTSVPIWVCGALIGCLSVLTFLMPFEPSLKRSV